MKPARRSFVVSEGGRSMATSFLRVVALLALGFVPICSIAAPTGFATVNVRCKYSVRDVAFVNVHGRSWQLHLIKPSAIQKQVFDAWNETLRTKLADSNVGFVWHDSDSDEAIQLVTRSLVNETSMPKEFPAMFLSGPEDVIIPWVAETNLSFDHQIDLLVVSPARKHILNQLVDTLCVVLLIESGGQNDVAAMTAAKSAIEQVDRQMWTLEKPTDEGPVLETVSVEDIETEKWLLSSLGVDVDVLPAIVIVYGQGRRLGENLTGDDITTDKIVGRASICGRDCECDLNRDWLYGQQMIHVWNKKHERMAEGSLSFDPKSAFVIAEVAQIIQKNTSAFAPNERVNLGGGLVIHDLNSVDDTRNSIADNPGEEPRLEESANKSNSTVHPAESRQNISSGSTIPWTLLAVLSVALIAVSFWMFRKATRAS